MTPLVNGQGSTTIRLYILFGKKKRGKDYIYAFSFRIFVYIHILLCEKAAIPAKGQLISKGLFGILNSSKNRTKTIRFFIRFLEELKTPDDQSPFEINWPLAAQCRLYIKRLAEVGCCFLSSKKMWAARSSDSEGARRISK